jgi:hypothetical protein
VPGHGFDFQRAQHDFQYYVRHEKEYRAELKRRIGQ